MLHLNRPELAGKREACEKVSIITEARRRLELMPEFRGERSVHDRGGTWKEEGRRENISSRFEEHALGEKMEQAFGDFVCGYMVRRLVASSQTTGCGWRMWVGRRASIGKRCWMGNVARDGGGGQLNGVYDILLLRGESKQVRTVMGEC